MRTITSIDLSSIDRNDPHLGLMARRYDAAVAEFEIVHAEIDRAPATISQQRLAQLRESFDDAVAELERTRTNLENAARNQLNPVDPEISRQARSLGISVLSETLTYRPDHPETSFFRDAWSIQSGSGFASEAGERLHRNSREQADLLRARGVQLRDVGTGAFAGLVVPQYLVDKVADLARAGSPLLNALTSKQQLPDEGLQLNISRITTGSAVAAQATENTAVQETDMDDTLLTVNIRTYAGMQDVSRQAIERGHGIDEVVYRDLVRAYMTKVNSDVINADGTAGTHLGIRSTPGIVSVAYTDASPTVPELFVKMADAMQQVTTGIFIPASLIVMHPRRWAWMLAAQDTNNRPFVVPNPNGPFNALAVGDAARYGQVVGQVLGLPVITDGTIPTNLGAGTNEDVILVLSNPELIWWDEGGGLPRQLRFEEAAAPQSIRLAVWGYSAFTAGRYPLASAVIGGTGLVTPTF